MLRVEKVKVYDVRGFLVCAKEEEDLELYLSDVPKEMIENQDYLGEKYVLAMGNEFTKDMCKELRHMKVNRLFDTEEEVMSVQMP